MADRKTAGEFAKVEHEFIKACGVDATFAAFLRWLADPRTVGMRHGWSLLKVGYPQAEEQPVATGNPE